MTETTETLHLEGGPLDGQAMTVPAGHGQTFVNALAYRRDDGTLADPRTEIIDRGGEPDLPLSAWPPDIKARIVPVEYHIDAERGVAVFREPATIRDTSPREQQDREWVAADARKQQQPRWLAWKAAATRLGKVVGSGRPADCQHEGGRCQTDAMHVARLAVDAILDDGLHIVEPTRLTDGGEALAYLIHEATERIAPEHGYAMSKTPWESVPEQSRRLSAAVAADVLGHLDAQGRVVTITLPEDAPPDLDFHGLGDVLREEAGASLLLALPKALGLTIETLSEEQMRDAGWARVTPTNAPTPPDDMVAEPGLPEPEGDPEPGAPVVPTDPITDPDSDAHEMRREEVDPHPEEQHDYGKGCDICDGNVCPYCLATPERIDAEGTFVWAEHDRPTVGEANPLTERCPGSGLPVGQPK